MRLVDAPHPGSFGPVRHADVPRVDELRTLPARAPHGGRRPRRCVHHNRGTSDRAGEMWLERYQIDVRKTPMLEGWPHPIIVERAPRSERGILLAPAWRPELHTRVVRRERLAHLHNLPAVSLLRREARVRE